MIEIQTLEVLWVPVKSCRTHEHSLGKWLIYILADGTEGLASPSQWRIRNAG